MIDGEWEDNLHNKEEQFPHSYSQERQNYINKIDSVIWTVVNNFFDNNSLVDG